MTTPLQPARPLSLRKAEWAAIGAFWGVLAVLSIVREALEPWREGPMKLDEIVEPLAEFGLWALATPLVFWLVGRYPVERGAWAGRLALQIAVGVLIAVVIEAVTRGWLRPMLDGPPRPGRVWSLGGAVGRLWFLNEFIVYLAVLAAGYARAALADARERRAEAVLLLAERAQLQSQLTEAKLQALQAQLRPHFLFNTLNAVSALVERDPAGVRTLVARLSSLLRRVLDVEPEREVPLGEEAAFVRDYLDVQRVRFQGQLETEEGWEPGTSEALVPPLVLQPLVENAVVHGVARLEDTVGLVRVGARREGGRLVLTVTDNGPGLEEPAERAGGVGLRNTRERLEALYGSEGTLDVRPAPAGGVVAEVTLPFRTAAPASGTNAEAPRA